MKELTNTALIQKLKSLAREEAHLTAEVIRHLEEADRRGLHLQMGYPDLKTFCMNELGYSDPAAYRRVNAMRVARELPELKPAIETGELNLTTLLQVGGFFSAEKKKKGKPYSKPDKLKLIQDVMRQSTRQTERTLASLSPEPRRAERERAISATDTEVTFVAPAELMADFERLRAIWGHLAQGAKLTYAELFAKMAELALDRVDPERKQARVESRRAKSSPERDREREQSESAPAESAQPHSASSGVSVHREISAPKSIPAESIRKAWIKDQGRCSFVDPKTGRMCGSRHRLQVDHIYPRALGGSDAPENLRLVCRAHNLHLARQTFGAEKVPSSKSA